MTTKAQPKIHQVTIAITTDELHAAVDAGVVALAGQSEPELDTIGKLQTAGRYHKYLGDLVVAALTSHLA